MNVTLRIHQIYSWVDPALLCSLNSTCTVLYWSLCFYCWFHLIKFTNCFCFYVFLCLTACIKLGLEFWECNFFFLCFCLFIWMNSGFLEPESLKVCFGPSEAEDGVPADPGEGLERGGDAGLLWADRSGSARLHRSEGRSPPHHS